MLRFPQPHSIRLAQLGYEVKSPDNERWLDTLSEEVFSGYVRLGRLYDRTDRRSRFHDIRPGDIVRFSTLGSYAVVPIARMVAGITMAKSLRDFGSSGPRAAVRR